MAHDAVLQRTEAGDTWVAAGTIFLDVLVWKVTTDSTSAHPLYRLKGHEGSIHRSCVPVRLLGTVFWLIAVPVLTSNTTIQSSACGKSSSICRTHSCAVLCYIHPMIPVSQPAQVAI